ncbi:prolipoprotein diacylglyceryltransferase [Microbacterium terrae]|uniref:prolipoprotein diacylglyceryl transferase n=1 Tax=Microbacterium terrae TaxID=69369 RepID=UPI001B3A7BBF|nr:prolipoprotein diacylglyceryl transferase family protein [Microbacterium terrae]MBP1076980.1 prolipoprotein diacylglyceryltransferase [Microbacterium terrae]GLJ99574.1 diacylglyceryl transferase [Microbacterium terrae]
MIGLPAAGDGVVHAVFVALGIAAGIAVFAWEVRRRGLHDDRLWIIAGTCLAFGAIGSRVGTWWQQVDPSANDTLAQWWMDGNRSVLAGLVGAWIGVHVGKLITRYSPSTGDLFAPAVALAIGIGRIGCLLTELPGHPTGGDWGIILTPEHAAALGGPAGVGLHPTYLYEALFQIAAFAVLWRMRDRMRRPGELFVAYVAAYALFRFLVEFARANEQVWLGLTRPQWFLLVMLPLLAWRVVRIARPLPAASPVPSPLGGRDD